MSVKSVFTRGFLSLIAATSLLGAVEGCATVAQLDSQLNPTERKVMGDHRSLARYYEKQAQINKTKAQYWDFAADYYEKFPGAYSGEKTLSDHVANLRSVAEDFWKAAEHDQELFEKHRSLMRKDG